jgi:hypothetical protein
VDHIDTSSSSHPEASEGRSEVYSRLDSLMCSQKLKGNLQFRIIAIIDDHRSQALKLCPEELSSFPDGKTIHLVRIPNNHTDKVSDYAAAAIDKVLTMKFNSLNLFYGCASSTGSNSLFSEFNCGFHKECR